jgi:hypothetical protein
MHGTVAARERKRKEGDGDIKKRPLLAFGACNAIARGQGLWT